MTGTVESIGVKRSDLVVRELWWQKQGLQFTGSGYGGKIPTRYLYRDNGILKRVYCAIYSNNGSLYIVRGKERLYLTVEE